MVEEHISSAFDADLSELNDSLASMGGLAADQLRKILKSLTEGGENLDALIENDRTIDNLEADINVKVAEIIAMRAPIATDLRVVLSAIKIAAMLERIGDFASNIAKRSKQIIASNKAGAVIPQLQNMGGLASEMVVDVMDALKSGDSKKAMAVWEKDIEIDRLHNSITEDIVKLLDKKGLPAQDGAHCLFILKNIERIGDLSTGIAEQIYFRIHGEVIDKVRPKEGSVI